MLPPETLQELRRHGRQLTPQVLAANREMFTAAHEAHGYRAPIIQRDQRYGADARHLLDIHTTADAADWPVLLFVHGGGFVTGDKTQPGSPFYDHVGGWATERGMVAVTMTYRLAPAHRWPAGAEDVAAATSWVRQRIAGHGGDPGRIVLAGHSAGATHVASYVAGHAGNPADTVAGAALISGIYDPATSRDHPAVRAYFGDDTDRYPQRSTLSGLVATAVPLLVVVAELDLPGCYPQAAALLDAMLTGRGTLPLFTTVPDHTHLSEISALGLDDEAFGAMLARFTHRAGMR